jgi:hypothetical protein
LVEEMNVMHGGDEKGCHWIVTGIAGGELGWSNLPWTEALYLYIYEI